MKINKEDQIKKICDELEAKLAEKKAELEELRKERDKLKWEASSGKWAAAGDGDAFDPISPKEYEDNYNSYPTKEKAEEAARRQFFYNCLCKLAECLNGGTIGGFGYIYWDEIGREWRGSVACGICSFDCLFKDMETARKAAEIANAQGWTLPY